MSRRTTHPTNPSNMEHWSNMPDDDVFYVVQPGHTVSTKKYIGETVRDGRTLPMALPGDPIHSGSIVPPKAFGPGADLQRLVDDGAILQATYEQTEELRRQFAPDNGRTEATASVQSAGHTGHDPTETKAKADQDKGSAVSVAIPGEIRAATAGDAKPATLTPAVNPGGGFNQPPKNGK